MNSKSFGAVFALFLASAAPGLAQKNEASPLAPPAFSSTSAPASQAKQFRLGHLTITGNTHTKLFVILRMMPLSEADIFNQPLWEFGLEQINRSGLFEPIQPADVVITPDDATGIVVVELHLKERDRQRIDLSGGGGTTGGASISVDYSNTNLTGRGDRLVGRARIGTRERSGGASFSIMSYGKLPISFDVSGFFERLEFVNASTLGQGREPLFVERTAGGSIGAFLPLNRSRYTIAATTRAGLIYSFTSTNVADALVMTTTTIRSLEQGGLRIGIRIRASHIRAFGEPFREQALSTVRGVPVFRRVFVGGETEVRGYDVNSIAPLARVERFVISDGNAPLFLSSEVRPVGGDTELLFNAEYRVPIIWRLSSAAFFDIGTSFDSRSLIKESFETMTRVQPTGAPVTVLTVLKPLKPGQDFLPGYRASLGGELRFPIPVLNIPVRLIFAWNPNSQKVVPDGALLAPEKRFAFRVGFSRTL